MWLQDQYLSPLLYNGVNVGITNEWWQAFRGKNKFSHGVGEDRLSCKSGENGLFYVSGEKKYTGSWEHIGKVGVQGCGLQNTPKSNKIYALGVNAGWGAYYTWKWTRTGNSHSNKITHSDKISKYDKISNSDNYVNQGCKSGFQIGVGPYLAADFMPRYIVNNVNKPYSMDIAADIDAMAFVSYSFGGKKTSYRLRYMIRTNLIGVDFMPDYWQSYYELTEGIAGKIRCAGMWNHRYLNHELTLDMQFKHSTWRIGVRHEYLEYGEKSMWFSREQVSAVIGTCFRYRTKGNHRLTE